MRIYGLLSIVVGIIMVAAGVGMIIDASSANLLSLGLALILSLGGFIVFGSGGVILAVMSLRHSRVDDTTGPIRTIDV